MTVDRLQVTVNNRSMNEKGQVILALILIMTVALAIGLSIVQKSLVDVSTSTKVEQSSRAFSAAEAGIEKALRGDSSGVNFADNNSSAQVADTGFIPPIPAPGNRQDALEYPPLAKEDIAHFWLADFNAASNPPPAIYTQNSLDVYWGNSKTDRPAIELTFIYYKDSQYLPAKRYFDPIVRNPPNDFSPVTCSGSNPIGTNNYQCYIRVGGSQDSKGPLPSGLMLARARLLYNTTSQPLAIQGVNNCGQACSIPPQARLVFSTGSSGETQRRVRVFQINKVVPPYFDFAIFSAGEINK